MRQMTGLNELRERGMMTWIEQEHGWVAAPEEIVKAFSKDGFEECNRETATSRREWQPPGGVWRSEEHTSELQSRLHLVCRLLLEKKKKIKRIWKATDRNWPKSVSDWRAARAMMRWPHKHKNRWPDCDCVT